MRQILCFGLLVFLWACGSAGMKNLHVQSDYNSVYEFSKLKRFAFTPETGIVIEGNQEQTEFVNARIQRAIQAELGAKGFASASPPDFWITYDAALKNKKHVSQRLSLDMADLGSANEMREVETPYTEGTLVLAVMDSKTAKTIWRGSAQAEIEKKVSAEERDERIRLAVNKILATFPPDFKKGAQ